MLTRTKMVAVLLITFVALFSLTPLCLAAAPQPDKPTKMTILVNVSDSQIFWSYPYITKDGKVRKPAAVQVEWSAAFGLAPNKTEVIPFGQHAGKLIINTEKNAIVDIQINVIDANKVVLGTTGLQVRNSGQEEAFLIAPPESTMPLVSYDPDFKQRKNN